jgi:hypothetical protein
MGNLNENAHYGVPTMYNLRDANNVILAASTNGALITNAAKEYARNTTAVVYITVKGKAIYQYSEQHGFRSTRH